MSLDNFPEARKPSHDTYDDFAIVQDLMRSLSYSTLGIPLHYITESVHAAGYTGDSEALIEQLKQSPVLLVTDGIVYYTGHSEIVQN